MKSQITLIALLFAFIIGCSAQNNTTEDIKESISKTASNFWIKNYDSQKANENIPEPKLSIDQNQNSSDIDNKNAAVELMWLLPEGRVTKYLLRYGTESNNLDSVIEISTKELSPIMHPKFGKVYKYLLGNVPSKTKIYYSLQAGNELGMSEPTPIASEDSYSEDNNY